MCHSTWPGEPLSRTATCRRSTRRAAQLSDARPSAASAIAVESGIPILISSQRILNFPFLQSCLGNTARDCSRQRATRETRQRGHVMRGKSAVATRSHRHTVGFVRSHSENGVGRRRIGRRVGGPAQRIPGPIEDSASLCTLAHAHTKARTPTHTHAHAPHAHTLKTFARTAHSHAHSFLLPLS